MREKAYMTVFWQVARALPGLRRVQWLVLLGIRHPGDAQELGRALASPPLELCAVRLDGAVMQYWRDSAATPALSPLRTQEIDFVRLWRQRQENVLAFALALHPRLGAGSVTGLLQKELLHVLTCMLCMWAW